MPSFAEKMANGQNIAHIKTLQNQCFWCREFAISNISIACATREYQ